MKGNRNSALFTLLISVILLLTGCAGQINMPPTLTSETQLEASEGLVVARGINGSAYRFPFNHIMLAPQNVNENKKVKFESLTSLPYPYDDTTVFAAPLKAGSYSLTSLYSYFILGDYHYSRYGNTDAAFGTFSVKPGEVTDLGTLIYYPKPQEDHYINTVLRIPSPVSGEVLTNHFPFYSFDRENVNTWDEDGANEDRENLYVSVAQNPVKFRHRYQAADGTLYFLASLGVIVTRSPDGEWGLDAVDTNLPTYSIMQSHNGALLLGGHGGKVFYKAAGEEWVDVSLTDQTQNVFKVNFVGETMEVIAATETSLSVYKAEPSHSVTWSKMNTFSTSKGWETIKQTPEVATENQKVKNVKRKAKKQPRNKRILHADTVVLGGRNYISVEVQSMSERPSRSNADTLTFQYSMKDWAITVLSDTEVPEFKNIVEAGAIQVGIKKPSFWSFRGARDYYRVVPETGEWQMISEEIATCDGEYITAAGCATGAKQSTDSFIMKNTPWFVSESEGYVIVKFSDRDIWTYETTYTDKIFKTVDGGKTWLDTQHELPRTYCWQQISEVKDVMLVSCEGASGDFFESEDGGATWNHVRQHENF